MNIMGDVNVRKESISRFKTEYIGEAFDEFLQQFDDIISLDDLFAESFYDCWIGSEISLFRLYSRLDSKNIF